MAAGNDWGGKEKGGPEKKKRMTERRKRRGKQEGVISSPEAEKKTLGKVTR